MNIINSLTARIEEYRKTNKKPCKSYATEKAAIKEAEKVSKHVTEYFGQPENRSLRYVVFKVEAWGRWVCCFDMQEMLSRSNVGGYVMICGDHFVY